MFDSVLQRKKLPERRLGTGAVLSVVGHAVLLAAVLLAPRKRADDAAEGVTVTFFAEPARRAGGSLGTPTLPAAPAAAKSEAPRPRPAQAVKPRQPPTRALAETTAPRTEPAQEAAKTAPASNEEAPKTEPAKTDAPGSATAAGSQPGGGQGSSSGQSSGTSSGSGQGQGVSSGKATAAPTRSTQILPFGAGMTRPRLLSGHDPAYTREARVARVSGTMIVKCVITTAGRIEGCRIIKGLPHMERAVLEAMASRHYTPVMYQGRAVAVDYVFNIKLVLPDG